MMRILKSFMIGAGAFGVVSIYVYLLALLIMFMEAKFGLWWAITMGCMILSGTAWSFGEYRKMRSEAQRKEYSRKSFNPTTR